MAVGALVARKRARGASGCRIGGVAGVTHVVWNKRVTGCVTRAGRVVFTRGELTCISRACMLGVNCRLLPRVGCAMRLGLVSGE